MRGCFFVRFCGLFCGVIELFVGNLHGDSRGVPWVNGETLIYEVKWGVLNAAEGMFRAEDKDDRWRFSLNLKTVGVVDALYRVRSQFVSIQQKNPWRSIGYYENRKENNRERMTQSIVDYRKAMGIFLNKVSGEKRIFGFQDRVLDDLGSVLYGARLVDWQRAQKKRVRVYEKGEVKTGWIQYKGCVEKSVVGWPKQRLLWLYGEPDPDDGGKRRGHVKMWIADDQRKIPLYARVKFRFGSFDVILKEALPYGWSRGVGKSE
jgi:hypothetical protein